MGAGIEVKLQAFEGPLELLLHLIEKNKVSIYVFTYFDLPQDEDDAVNYRGEAYGLHGRRHGGTEAGSGVRYCQRDG